MRALSNDKLWTQGHKPSLSGQAPCFWNCSCFTRSRSNKMMNLLVFMSAMNPYLIPVKNWNPNNGESIGESAVQYMKHFIYHFTSTLHRLIRTHKWPAPNVSGFIAQLVWASHRYCEVTGSKWNLVEVLTFSGFCTQLLKNCVHNCDDHSLLGKSNVLIINGTVNLFGNRLFTSYNETIKFSNKWLLIQWNKALH